MIFFIHLIIQMCLWFHIFSLISTSSYFLSLLTLSRLMLTCFSFFILNFPITKKSQHCSFSLRKHSNNIFFNWVEGNWVKNKRSQKYPFINFTVKKYVNYHLYRSDCHLYFIIWSDIMEASEFVIYHNNNAVYSLQTHHLVNK